MLLENGKNVDGVTETGEYTVKAIFTVNDSNYAEIETMQSTVVITKKRIAISWFDFSETTPSSVKKGDDATFEFCAEATEGLSFVATVYMVSEDGNVTAIEPVAVIPDENGVASLLHETENLNSGTYACVFTVSAENSNYVLSSGSESLDYRFNFEIVD